MGAVREIKAIKGVEAIRTNPTTMMVGVLFSLSLEEEVEVSMELIKLNPKASAKELTESVKL